MRFTAIGESNFPLGAMAQIFDQQGKLSGLEAVRYIITPTLRKTITQVLTQESYKANAVQLQQLLHDARGVYRAVDIIEKVISTGDLIR